MTGFLINFICFIHPNNEKIFSAVDDAVERF